MAGEGSGAVWRQGNQVFVRLHVTPTDATESIQVSHQAIWASTQPPSAQVALTLSLKYKPSTPSVRPSDVRRPVVCVRRSHTVQAVSEEIEAHVPVVIDLGAL